MNYLNEIPFALVYAFALVGVVFLVDFGVKLVKEAWAMWRDHFRGDR